jgi:hypothetical protein
MDLHKVVAKRSAFSTFPSAPNKSENKQLKKLCKTFYNNKKINLILSYVNHILKNIGPFNWTPTITLS